MSVYAIFTRVNTLDPEELQVYLEHAVHSLQGHPAKPLAVYGQQETLEGPDSEGTVILEFPDREAAMAWYNSPETTSTREHRLKGGTYRGVLVEGVNKSQAEVLR